VKISNAKLANGNLVNIEISNGLISKVDKATAGKVTDGIDAKSKLIIPGLVDLHTHLREPGREDAETVLTGSRSAVAGGYTAVSAMANTNPVADNAGVVEQIYRISARIGLPGWPAIAEEAIIARDILLAEHVQSRLHICHVTTAGGVELIRWAKQRGIQVTAEVTPHHLLLTDELVENYDPIYKVNPPLRTEKDVQALREGLAEGVIDVVATDHAPHPSEDKDCEFQAGAFGMVGLETALSVVVKTMIETKLMTWSDLIDRMSIAPARIAGYTNQGNEVAVGNSANLILIDQDRKWRVDRDKLKSKSKNTPFNGMELPSVITDVFHNGDHVLQDSLVVDKKSSSNE